MPHPADWPLTAILLTFAAATVAIAFAGAKMAALADQLADRTGLGEAVLGGVFLGVSTSLPGITTSVTAAMDGYAALAVSNAVGGIAAQTLFLAIADLFYRRSNLEHAAASPENLVQGTVLVGLLAMLMMAITGPNVTLGHVHFATPLLIVAYAGGIVLVRRTRAEPMWRPRMTAETVSDTPDESAQRASLRRLLLGFGGAAAVIFVAGIAVARTGEAIVTRMGVSESVVGSLFTAVATSLPELITCVACVRRGALTLAVSDIVGGNAFDVLFVCVADVFYLEGSLYHAATHREVFVNALAILVNVVLLLGLIQREKSGIGNIGFESVLILLLYAAGVVALTVGM